MLAVNSLIEGMNFLSSKYNKIPLNQTVQQQWDESTLKFKFAKKLNFIIPKTYPIQNDGAWLYAFPFNNISTLMDDESF